MHDYKNIIYREDGNISRITLNRPEVKNAINFNIIDELGDALEKLSHSGKARVLVISGGNKYFSSGIDVNDLPVFWKMDQQELGKHLKYMQEKVYNKLENLEIPTIAEIQGFCIGAGLELIICCDFRFAGKRSIFSLPEVNLGVIPDLGGSHRLSKLIGFTRAKKMALLGEVIKAGEALSCGLIDRCLDDKELPIALEKFCNEIIRKPPISLRLVKSLVNQGWNRNFLQDIEKVIEYQYTCLKTKDHKEAITASREKRLPEFKGE
ncbi:MAG: enoyl-CoA hydratase/isomerase family protein [Thermodesulfobacteriota bacterium]|nr:enoyl-CoA hydratase/isomerase family protein [Thermodesulfobacteriota bacterium]